MISKSDAALIALRRIQRRTEQASRRLADTAGFTPSQLRVLQILSERGQTSAGDIAELTQLSHATITSLIDKLEERGFVARRRCDDDRRRIWLSIEPLGTAALAGAPDLLQDTFSERFNALPGWQQSMLMAALEQVAELIDAESVDAAPVLDVGRLDEEPN